MPEEAGSGATPQSIAQAASDRIRPGLSPGGDEQLPSGFNADARALDESRAEVGDEGLDEVVEVGHFVVELQDTPGQRPHRDPGGGGGMVEVVIVGPPGRDGPQQLHPGQGTDLVVFWPALFAAMLNCWLTDEQQWPKNRTHQMFGEWFDIQMCPVVEDLHLDEELVELD